MSVSINPLWLRHSLDSDLVGSSFIVAATECEGFVLVPGFVI